MNELGGVHARKKSSIIINRLFGNLGIKDLNKFRVYNFMSKLGRKCQCLNDPTLMSMHFDLSITSHMHSKIENIT